MAPTEAINIMKPGKKNADGTYEVTYVPVSTQTVDMAKRISDNLPMDMPITGDMGITLQDVRDGKATLEKFVAQLSIEEMAIIIRGEGMSNPRVAYLTTAFRQHVVQMVLVVFVWKEKQHSFQLEQL